MGTVDGEAEWGLVAQMRTFVESQDPSAKETDNYTLRRFLRARYLDIEKGSSLFLKYLKWRKHEIPNGSKMNCPKESVLCVYCGFQNYYPERLGKVLLIHVPQIFMKAWKIVSPFLDKNTKEKLVFVEDKKLQEVLLEDIDESDQLPEIYGGKLPLVPIENA
ncbi:SEC14 cytosolic factor [Carex littledalei]|uniref:SEC14 cytosolic factor n=1 Tax=Carex littledalei TaxID=544730 RepID=A0A833VY28_9POAL|nr:SEC14 cytosolic factor [Carex littledalei]